MAIELKMTGCSWTLAEIMVPPHEDAEGNKIPPQPAKMLTLTDPKSDISVVIPISQETWSKMVSFDSKIEVADASALLTLPSDPSKLGRPR